MTIEQGIGIADKGAKGLIGKLRPMLNQEVIVGQVDRDARHPAHTLIQSSATATIDRVVVGKSINGAMAGDTIKHRRTVAIALAIEGSFDKIPQKITEPRFVIPSR
jgi:hypothetical protein